MFFPGLECLGCFSRRQEQNTEKVQKLYGGTEGAGDGVEGGGGGGQGGGGGGSGGRAGGLGGGGWGRGGGMRGGGGAGEVGGGLGGGLGGRLGGVGCGGRLGRGSVGKYRRWAQGPHGGGQIFVATAFLPEIRKPPLFWPTKSRPCAGGPAPDSGDQRLRARKSPWSLASARLRFYFCSLSFRFAPDDRH
jgi:hypothetical protein